TGPSPTRAEDAGARFPHHGTTAPILGSAVHADAFGIQPVPPLPRQLLGVPIPPVPANRVRPGQQERLPGRAARAPSRTQEGGRGCPERTFSVRRGTDAPGPSRLPDLAAAHRPRLD